MPFLLFVLYASFFSAIKPVNAALNAFRSVALAAILDRVLFEAVGSFLD